MSMDMFPRRYRRRIEPVEAMVFRTNDPAQAHAVYLWVEQNITGGSFDPSERWPDDGVSIDPATGEMVIICEEFEERPKDGDFITRFGGTYFQVHSPEVFERLFEAA